jgi:DNA-binding GntR family transcriptional regulator
MSRACEMARPSTDLQVKVHGTIHSSSMETLKIDKDEPVALHDQVAAEIRRAIAEGEATQGERLPPAVDLATVLGVNKNTVIRALHILRDEGLLDFTRGRGVRVVGTPQRGAVMSRIDELLTFARTQGYRRDEVVALIQARG